ncbi:hypothetical protein X882_6008 [Burkholderia pseudomallei MSHR4303]|nr:hypothetical protein X882_6008 [Burkholderia pseudomallei MSHR4303]
MDHHALRAALVIERDLTRVLITARTLDRTRHQPRVADVLRQVIRRRVLAVVDDARHERPIEIAVDIRDEHFLPDPRHRDHAPALARPCLRHAYPARRIRLGRLVAVPMEMHANPPELVGMHFRHLRTHHRRALDARHFGTRRRQQRPKRLIVGKRAELHRDVAPLRRAVRSVLDERQLAVRHVVPTIAPQRRMPDQRERPARGQRARVRLAHQRV